MAGRNPAAQPIPTCAPCVTASGKTCFDPIYRPRPGRAASQGARLRRLHHAPRRSSPGDSPDPPGPRPSRRRPDRHRQDRSLSLPLIQRLVSQPRRVETRSVRALILSPTRELAAQIETSIRAYAQFTTIKSAVIFGGVPVGKQIRALGQHVDILVATRPGACSTSSTSAPSRCARSSISSSTRPTRCSTSASSTRCAASPR